MPEYRNELGLPTGFPVEDWMPCAHPPYESMTGDYCYVVPLDPELHAADIHQANILDKENRMWVYLAYGPFESEKDYRNWIDETCLEDDPQFYAIVDKNTGIAAGVASYLRIDPKNGAIEVGHINFAPPLQHSTAATEAMYLMMKRIFDELGYRRYEWKCDALNARSCRAAERLGFTYEGTFRQAMVYNGRNRDTAWYAITDREWPSIRATFQKWLDPDNFDETGKQRNKL